MKKSLLLLTLGISGAMAANAEGTGVYLTGTFNDWNHADPAWEFQLEEDTPGWAYLDITTLGAGAEFRIVGPDGREYGMKNNRNTIRRNSLHLMTLNGANNMVVCDESLDGVHLMLQYGEFFTDKYLGIITRTDESELLYGACDAESVTPTLLPAGENGLYSAPVSLTTGWYVIKAYQLSNATQTVCNFGPAEADATLTPGAPLQLAATSNLTPALSPIPVPTAGAGDYNVTFNPADLTVKAVSMTGIGDIDTESLPAEYYSMEGLRLERPEGLVIERRGASSRLVIKR